MDFIRAGMTDADLAAERMRNSIADAVVERLLLPTPVKMLTGAEARAIERQRSIAAEEDRRSRERHKRHLYAQVPSLRHLAK